MSARGTHRQKLPQPTGGRSGTSSLDESRPAGWAPYERRHLLGLQEGRAHLRAMLEGASKTNTRIHSKKKNERHVCASEKEAALLDLARLQVPDNGPHLPSTSTRWSGQPQIHTCVHTDRSCQGSHSDCLSSPLQPRSCPVRYTTTRGGEGRR